MVLLLIFCGVMFLFCGCQKSDFPGEGSYSTFTLNIEAAKNISSKAGDTNQWNQAVEGNGVYSAAAFLFSENSLVAYREVELQELASSVALSFDKNIIHGKYSLYVVANYSNFGEYTGLSGFKNILSSMIAGGKITQDFTNYSISSVDGVCKVVPHPLSAVMDVELVPGVNKIEASVLRSVSRVRISVENNSDTPLNISSLTFSNLFTQKSAWLFNNKGYNSQRGSITVSSSNALVPFTGSSSSPTVIAAKGKEVIFDAYILESAMQQGESGYSYKLDLKYAASGGYVSKVVDIPLQTINEITAQPEDVKEIKRNDFIDVTVKVSYSKNSGTIDFEVVPWNSGGGSIDFE